MTTQETLPVKSVIDAWTAQLKRTDTLFNGLTDEDLQMEVSPGRNRGVYLLGHLTAVHDMMLPLLNLEERHFQQLDDAFITSPDKSSLEIPTTKDLRLWWKEVNDTLAAHIEKLQPEEWLQKHNAVSEEDFVKEPHRNRLAVLISRTNHLSSHYGQLLFLKK